MRVVLLLCLAVALAHARGDHEGMFNSFKAQYNKKYSSEVEEAKRFRIFTENMERAAKFQSANPLATFGANEFADVSAQEFKNHHNAEAFYQRTRDAFPKRIMTAEEKKAAAGQAQDWRPKGAVTPIKNQAQCGSCWAFSTTGGIEGQWFLAGHPLTSLSEQELVSCATNNDGCNGGLMDLAFEWLISAHNGSIVTESSYPYVSGTGNVPACSMSGKKFGAQIDGHKDIEHDEDAMAAFVFASGPLSIGVDATSWQTYTSGIMTNCQSQQVDHGVLIVGFDDNNSPPYWIIKNSWGKTWGENGYIRVEKGTNQCLIKSNACTSEVKKANPNPTPVPPPSPSSANFIQKTCIDDKCQTCSELTFKQNECISGASQSYKGTCATDGLIVEAFETRNCTGSSVITVNPINECSIIFRKTGSERFVQNICGKPPLPPPPPAPKPTTTPAPAGPTPTSGPTPAPTFPSGWLDLFPPPYSSSPTIMMAISALNDDVSYVPGGENGAGFTVFEFNNQENGQFTPLQMPDMTLMIMGIAVGGTVAVPKGVVGGVGIGNGVQYFVNATTLLPSTIPTLLVETQDIRMSRNGVDALVMDQGSNSVLYSADSGKTFNEKKVNVKYQSNCTGLRYGAMVDSQTYYVSMGNWPSNNQQSKNTVRVTEAYTVSRAADGKLKHKMSLPQPSAAFDVEAGSSSAGGCNAYSAMIAKTTDGGNTWTAQVDLNNNDFYFNGMDCFSATHCIAVGEGFNNNAGGHIYITTDGKTWTQSFFAASGAQGQYSFMSVRFSGKDGKEAWVGGSLMVSQVESTGLFFKTADGGKTWKQYPHGLPNLGSITSIDMLPSGIGFATALTIFDDSTVLRYDPTGPAPPGFFIQSHCQNANCTFLCQNVSFPQDMCLQANSGSAMASCVPGAVEQKTFQSSDCTGAFTVTKQPLDQCLNDSGSYFQNFCPNQKAELLLAMPHHGKKMKIARQL